MSRGRLRAIERGGEKAVKLAKVKAGEEAPGEEKKPSKLSGKVTPANKPGVDIKGYYILHGGSIRYKLYLGAGQSPNGGRVDGKMDLRRIHHEITR
ncbi:hypothetical protein ACFL6Y_05495 [Elusimicrobiota bacterium]